MTTLAAVGDLHFGPRDRGALLPLLRPAEGGAQALLLAGDLSNYGTPEEATALVEELEPLTIPVIAVLGNHDLESDQDAVFRAILEDGGIRVLEGDATTFDADGTTVGVAGTIGFGGGFPGATCADFGEPEMKAIVARARETASGLQAALEGLGTDLRVALTHYAPVRGTLQGENPELYPFLGSHYLADAIDLAGADVAIHGHAHLGSPEGLTPGYIPVRNVSRPVIGTPYEVLEFDEGRLRDAPTPP